jgi:hypothetical protein
MGCDFNSKILVGWRMSKNEVIQNFGRTIPEEVYTEKRFSSKTGKPKADVKVVTRKQQTLLEYKDLIEDFDDIEDFLSDMLGFPEFNGELVYSILYDPENVFEIVIGINLPNNGKRTDLGGFTYGPDLELPQDLFERIDRARDLLQKNCKIENLGPARIINAADCSY